jgi:hypothetical protein
MARTLQLTLALGANPYNDAAGRHGFLMIC